jgi:biopolymer transport protein ExbB
MRRYASSRFRIFLLAVLLGTVFLVAGTYAQDANGGAAAATGAAGAAKSQGNTGLVSLILSNMDFVFFTIVALSIAGLTFIIQGFIRNRAAVLLPEASIEEIRNLITQKKFKELMDFTEADPSFVSRALNPALKRAPSFNAMKEAMETALGEQTAEHFRRIEYLNIIGNLGPLLGLLGTVLGMIDAFAAMNRAGGNASPAELALGISKALCHTFLGLMLAVPCLAAFGWLRTIVDRLTVRGALIAEELLLMVKPQEKPAVAAAAAAAPPRPAMAIPQPAAMPAASAARKPMPMPAPAPQPLG